MTDSGLRRDLQRQITDAEDNDDQKRLSLLRLVQTAIQIKDQTARERKQPEMKDAAIYEMIIEMIAQRQTEIDQAERGGRIDHAEQEREEVIILEGFLPASCGDEELETVISAVIKELNATRLTDIGAVMARLMEQLDGRCDLQMAKDCACAQLKANAHDR